MQKRNNIIVGDLIIDQNYLIKLSGKSAEFNSKKYILTYKNFNLGGAGMVYTALKKLDKKVDFFTISSNKFREFFLNLKLDKIQFSNNHIVEKKRYWEGKKLVYQLNYVKLDDREIKNFQTKFLKKIIKIKNFSNIILCDYRYGIFSNSFTKNIIKILKGKGCEIYVDQQSTSKKPDIFKFRNVDYLVLNKDEFNKIFRKYKINHKLLSKKFATLQKRFNIKSFVIKNGPNGCLLFKENKIIISKPTRKTNSPLNTIGAGDYFLASFVNENKKNSIKRMKLANDYAFSKITAKNESKYYF